MYGWMAIAAFAIFGHELPKTSMVFWFMVQLAMLAGFFHRLPGERVAPSHREKNVGLT